MIGLIKPLCMQLLATAFSLFPRSGGGIVVRQRGGVAGTNEVQISETGTTATITVAPGAGSGQTFQIVCRDKAYSFTDGAGAGFTCPAAVIVNTNLYLDSSTVRCGSGYQLGFTSTSAGQSGSPDAYFTRLAAGVVGVTSWIQNTGGRSRVNADVTNAATTMANITGLSATLIAGRKYAGRLMVKCSDTAVDGIKFNFNGGSATMTSFDAGVTSNVQGATAGVTISSAISTELTFTAMNGTTDHWIAIDFTLVCNVAGTFIPQFAKNSVSVGSGRVSLGSWLFIEDVP